MAAPTTRFRVIPQNTAVADIDTSVERLAAIAGQAVVSIGAPATFSSVNLSGGAENSAVMTVIFDITADGGNSTIEDFRLWASTISFVEVASVIKFQALSGADEATPALTENYVADADSTDYTWGTMPETVPVAQNVYPSDEGASVGVAADEADDVIMWAMYAAIAAAEPVGTQNLQFSLRFSYS